MAPSVGVAWFCTRWNAGPLKGLAMRFAALNQGIEALDGPASCVRLIKSIVRVA
jgi:hypothetical protein